MKKLNKKILITGGVGYIGQNLISFFLKKKYQIYVIDNWNNYREYLLYSKQTHNSLVFFFWHVAINLL